MRPIRASRDASVKQSTLERIGITGTTDDNFSMKRRSIACTTPPSRSLLLLQQSGSSLSHLHAVHGQKVEKAMKACVVCQAFFFSHYLSIDLPPVSVTTANAVVHCLNGMSIVNEIIYQHDKAEHMRQSEYSSLPNHEHYHSLLCNRFETGLNFPRTGR